MSTETKIDIKPGRWKTRGGLDAVVEFKTEADTHWPFIGYIELPDEKACASWTEDGLHMPEEETEFDLISRIEDTATTN